MPAQTTPRSKRTAYASRYNKMYRTGHRQLVDATVTRRMLQALRAIGYSSPVLGEALGWSDLWVRELSSGRVRKNHTMQSVSATTAKKVADFYWAHHNKPHAGAGAKKAMTAARVAGWAAPAAWDDITDTKEAPKGVVKA